MALYPVRVISVVGATASGKTNFGLDIAEKIGGEIISSDSMQVYRYMDIGTAKPTPQEQARVPHHLIDILDPDQNYNAGKFQTDADRTIQLLAGKGTPSILLGGTGLYLRSLLYGIIQVPEIAGGTKEQVNKIFSEKGLPGCYAELKRLDPASAAKLHPNDITRIFRALEVFIETGQSIQHFHERHRFQQQRYPVLFFGIYRNREELYKRINERVMQMVKAGLVEETEKLLEMGYGPHLPSMNAIGYKQVIAYLSGKMDKETMISDIQQKSRIYAKKQITWHKKNGDIHWIRQNDNLDMAYHLIQEFLGK